MSVVSNLAAALRDETTRNPASLENVDMVRCFCLMYAASVLLQRQEERLTELEQLLQKPPRVIDCSLPPGATVLP